MNVWGYQYWNPANTTMDICLLFENGHKSTQTRCKVSSNVTKITTIIGFRFTGVFFINLEHLLHPTLVLLFIIWKGKMLTESALWTFCQNNRVMLTHTHSHSPGILLWHCSCHRNKKQISLRCWVFYLICSHQSDVVIKVKKFKGNFEVLLLNSGYSPESY